MTYTHEQLWELAQSWWNDAKAEVDAGAAMSLTYCADQLTELIGPLAFANPTTGDPNARS